MLKKLLWNQENIKQNAHNIYKKKDVKLMPGI